VITSKSQLSCNSMVDITKQENSINTDLKLFTIIKKRIIVELTSREADMQASVHPSEANQAGRS